MDCRRQRAADIRPVSRFGTETIEDAKAAVRLHGSKITHVQKAEDGQPSLKTFRGTYIPVGFNRFSDIQPGQPVALVEILKGGNHESTHP